MPLYMKIMDTLTAVKFSLAGKHHLVDGLVFVMVGLFSFFFLLIAYHPYVFGVSSSGMLL